MAARNQRRPGGSLLLPRSGPGAVAQLARDLGVPGIFVGDIFDSAAVLEKHPARALILHGKADHIVPFSHAQRLQTILPAARLVELDCGHNDCPFAQQEILQFLRTE